MLHSRVNFVQTTYRGFGIRFVFLCGNISSIYLFGNNIVDDCFVVRCPLIQVYRV
jgi:hypothetical protein